MSDLTPTTKTPDFAEITRLIESARQRAYQAVNTALIELYWQVGAYLSAKIKAAEWGEGVIEQLARHLASTQPGLRGFSAQNIWRMRQFHQAYQGQAILSPLVRELPWTHNLIILSRSKRPEEREFYLKMAAQEKWSKRELERQFDTALFERVVLSPAKVSPLVRQIHPNAASVFKDSYLVEFLDLPAAHLENDLQRGLLAQLRQFLLELGRDFCFVGSEYPLQVGKQDFAPGSSTVFWWRTQNHPLFARTPASSIFTSKRWTATTKSPTKTPPLLRTVKPQLSPAGRPIPNPVTRQETATGQTA